MINKRIKLMLDDMVKQRDKELKYKIFAEILNNKDTLLQMINKNINEDKGDIRHLRGYVECLNDLYVYIDGARKNIVLGANNEDVD